MILFNIVDHEGKNTSFMTQEDHFYVARLIGDGEATNELLSELQDVLEKKTYVILTCVLIRLWYSHAIMERVNEYCFENEERNLDKYMKIRREQRKRDEENERLEKEMRDKFNNKVRSRPRHEIVEEEDKSKEKEVHKKEDVMDYYYYETPTTLKRTHSSTDRLPFNCNCLSIPTSTYVPT
jgi:hypothetical protein